MKNKMLYLLICFMILLIVGCSNEKKQDLKLDISDLICIRNSDYIDYEDTEIITFKFNKNAVITQYEEKSIITLQTKEDALKYYNETKQNNPNINVNLNDKDVEVSVIFLVDEKNNYYKKTKQEIKKIYTEELFYECK